MLEHYDEILLEQYITAQNMNKKERDCYMQYIMNLKDISDSILCINSDDPSKYNINYMRFTKTIDGIIIDGVVDNGVETRWIDGMIIYEDDKIIVNSNFYRIGIYVNDDEREYSCVDTFSFENGNFIRESEYLNINSKFRDMVVLSDDELNSYYLRRIGKNNLVKTKKV